MKGAKRRSLPNVRHALTVYYKNNAIVYLFIGLNVVAGYGPMALFCDEVDLISSIVSIVRFMNNLEFAGFRKHFTAVSLYCCIILLFKTFLFIGHIMPINAFIL